MSLSIRQPNFRLQRLEPSADVPPAPESPREDAPEMFDDIDENVLQHSDPPPPCLIDCALGDDTSQAMARQWIPICEWVARNRCVTVLPALKVLLPGFELKLPEPSQMSDAAHFVFIAEEFVRHGLDCAVTLTLPDTIDNQEHVARFLANPLCCARRLEVNASGPAGESLCAAIRQNASVDAVDLTATGEVPADLMEAAAGKALRVVITVPDAEDTHCAQIQAILVEGPPLRSLSVQGPTRFLAAALAGITEGPHPYPQGLWLQGDRSRRIMFEPQACLAVEKLLQPRAGLVECRVPAWIEEGQYEPLIRCLQHHPTLAEITFGLTLNQDDALFGRTRYMAFVSEAMKVVRYRHGKAQAYYGEAFAMHAVDGLTEALMHTATDDKGKVLRLGLPDEIAARIAYFATRRSDFLDVADRISIASAGKSIMDGARLGRIEDLLNWAASELRGRHGDFVADAMARWNVHIPEPEIDGLAALCRQRLNICGPQEQQLRQAQLEMLEQMRELGLRQGWISARPA